MKLALIVNCWDDWALLRSTLRTMRPLVDGVIIIGSTKSNYGEHSPIPEDFKNEELHVREPHFHIPLHSETDKRNYGLSIAKKQGYTHFLTADADEVYLPEDFLKIKEKFKNSNLQGLVCPCVAYFKSPTLCMGRDVTLVPHIHKLTPAIQHEFNRKYPFSWINGQIRIDPSRSLNINSGVEYTEKIELHHFSWVRADYEKKIRNSTARANLERSSIRQDLALAKEGEIVSFYGKRLFAVINRFNIPNGELLCENLQPVASADAKN